MVAAAAVAAMKQMKMKELEVENMVGEIVLTTSNDIKIEYNDNDNWYNEWHKDSNKENKKE